MNTFESGSFAWMIMILKRKWVCGWLIVLLLVLDQGSKGWIATHLQQGQALAFGPFFNLRLAHNTGAAFSLFRNADGGISPWALWFLIVLALSVSLGLLWRLFISQRPLSRLRSLCYALISVGALGNVIDRIHQGFVIDFFDFHINTWHYATFNVADCAVVGGVILLFFCKK